MQSLNEKSGYQTNRKVWTILKYKADRLPLTLILVMFGIQLWAFFSLTWQQAIIFALISLPFLTYSAFFNHNQQHHNIFYSYSLNRSFEIILHFQTGLSPYSWVLSHCLGHHQHYLNQHPEQNKIDEASWTRKDGSVMSCAEYVVHILKDSNKAAIDVANENPKIKKEFIIYTAVGIGIFICMAIYNWQNALIIFFVPSYLMFMFIAFITYEQHSGLFSKDHYFASTNRLSPGYNWLTSNLGYHTAHHKKPGLHWSLLPEYHKEIEHLIPKELILDGTWFIKPKWYKLWQEKHMPTKNTANS